MNTHRSGCRPPSAVGPAKVAWALAFRVVAAVMIPATPSFAQSTATAPPASDDNERALRDAQNPIATTISVPFQSNTYFRTGPLENTSQVLIIQPVIPIKLTPGWNLISRWVTRVVYLPRVSADQGSQFGLGNLKPEFYFSPATTGKVIWGVGPKLYLPTATHHVLGINRMGGGPAAAIVAINGPWKMGIIAHNVWAGSGKERISEVTLSPFIYYNLKNGWYFVSSPVITANWVAESRDRWTAGWRRHRACVQDRQSACEHPHSGFVQRVATGLRPQLAAAGSGSVPFPQTRLTMSDHVEGPRSIGDPTADLTDLFAFTSLENASDAIDNANPFFRYPNIAGIAGSRCTGSLGVRSKGRGAVADWRAAPARQATRRLS